MFFTLPPVYTARRSMREYGRKKANSDRDRTTGKLHLGHYVGSLSNRVRLQDKYDSFILLADIQALTTHFENPDLIRGSIYDVAIDNLSVGLDPRRSPLSSRAKLPRLPS